MSRTWIRPPRSFRRPASRRWPATKCTSNCLSGPGRRKRKREKRERGLSSAPAPVRRSRMRSGRMAELPAPMMFPRRHLDAIRDGSITTAYRRWDRPRVKVGGTQRTAVGVVAFDAVTEVEVAAITEADAQAAGHKSVEEMLDLFGRRSPEWPIWRVDLHYAGEDPRVALRADDKLSKDDVAALKAPARPARRRVNARAVDADDARADRSQARSPRARPRRLARPRDEAVQARRPQAQGAGADGVAADRLPHLPARGSAARQAVHMAVARSSLGWERRTAPSGITGGTS